MSAADLEPWARRLATEARSRDVYVFFKHEPEAPSRALRLLEWKLPADLGH